jgi:hypothetical protein
MAKLATACAQQQPAASSQQQPAAAGSQQPADGRINISKDGEWATADASPPCATAQRPPPFLKTHPTPRPGPPLPPFPPPRRRAAVAARNVSLDGLSAMVLVPRNDEYVGAVIMHTGRPFTPLVLAFMLELVKPGSTVVDAGCNFGSFSVFFAAKVGPTGRVHCFEPQRKMAQVTHVCQHIAWHRGCGESSGHWFESGSTPHRTSR